MPPFLILTHSLLQDMNLKKNISQTGFVSNWKRLSRDTSKGFRQVTEVQAEVQTTVTVKSCDLLMIKCDVLAISPTNKNKTIHLY